MKTWLEQARYARDLCQKISTKHGGDDAEFLREYVTDRVYAYKNCLAVLVTALESVYSPV